MLGGKVARRQDGKEARRQGDKEARMQGGMEAWRQPTCGAPAGSVSTSPPSA